MQRQKNLESTRNTISSPSPVQPPPQIILPGDNVSLALSTAGSDVSEMSDRSSMHGSTVSSSVRGSELEQQASSLAEARELRFSDPLETDLEGGSDAETASLEGSERDSDHDVLEDAEENRAADDTVYSMVTQ